MVATITVRAMVHKVTTKSKVMLVTKVPMLIFVMK
jgi:hypothetical protein